MAPHLNTSSVSVKREPSASPPPPAAAANRSASSKRHSNRHHNTSNIEPTVAEANADILKAVQFRHRAAIDELLTKRSDLRLVDTAEKPATLSGFQLAEDEEIWMFQCARNVPVEQLQGVKLQLSGARKTVRLEGERGAIEYRSEEVPAAAAARTHSMVCRTRNGRKHELVSFAPVGTVRVHQEIQELLIADIAQPKQKLVPYPTGLKVRHPLHGNDFDKHTNLSDEVQSRLRSAVRASRRARTEPIEAETATSVPTIAVKQEKPAKAAKSAKKRKSTAVVVPEEAEADVAEELAPKKAKRVKKEKDTVKLEQTIEAVKEEMGANLDWLSAI